MSRRLTAIPPEAVFPGEGDAAPAERNFGKRVNRANEGKRLAWVRVRVSDARVVVVRGARRPCVRWHWRLHSRRRRVGDVADNRHRLLQVTWSVMAVDAFRLHADGRPTL